MSGIKLGRGATVHADSIETQPEDSVTRCGRSADMITGVSDAVTCKRCVTLTEGDARKAESAAAAVAAITDRADNGTGVEPWEAELLTDRAETDNVIMVDLRDECDVVAIVPTDAADNGTASDAKIAAYARKHHLSPEAEAGMRQARDEVLAEDAAPIDPVIKTVLRPWVTVSTREIDGVLTEVQVAYEDDGRPAATRYVPVETADNGTVTTHWTLADVAALPRNEAGATLVTLRDGDTADAPGTTKKVFAGIGLITFTFYGDGGVTAYPADGGGVYVRYLTETEKSARRETPDNGTGASLMSTPVPVLKREAPNPETGYWARENARQASATVPSVDGPVRYRAPGNGKRKIFVQRHRSCRNRKG